MKIAISEMIRCDARFRIVFVTVKFAGAKATVVCCAMWHYFMQRYTTDRQLASHDHALSLLAVLALPRFMTLGLV
jgi:hypothetical protein